MGDKRNIRCFHYCKGQAFLITLSYIRYLVFKKGTLRIITPALCEQLGTLVYNR